MAFRQPTYHRYHAQRHPELDAASPVNVDSPTSNELLDESQGWLLFPPNSSTAAPRTYSPSTQHTKWTADQSRRSECGSLETAAQSHDYERDASEHTEAILEEEEDAELDSLDSHLHEFRAEGTRFRESSRGEINSSGIPVLPTHDGLGSFRIDRTAMGESIQEHLYAFERYNPKRVKRRRETLELGQMALDGERMLENERIKRIEEWRLGQSQALLDEIQKVTRRRKHSISTERRSMIRDDQEEAAILGGALTGKSDQIDSESQLPENDSDNGFWSRITRRVIQDLMGIDDGLLSVLFGESLPNDLELSLTPSIKYSSNQDITSANMENDTWEYRLLNRIARELGLLVNQLSDHPGAFSTYLKVQQMPLPYAGLPIIPEIVPGTYQEVERLTTAASTPNFKPTLPVATLPLDIVMRASDATDKGETVSNHVDATPRPEAPIHWALEGQETSAEFTKEEWERQLDIKMVFRYLRSRFTSRPLSHQLFAQDASRRATSNTQDTVAGIARVLRHHPLVNRQKPFKVVTPHSPILHRRSSSCASHSTRMSARRNSGSSRPYWDINGSIGSGSLLASTGAWGEV